MPAIDDMTMEEIDAQMAQLRERRRALKKTGKVVERKINTLERRRNRLLEQVHGIDTQIAQLRQEASLEPAPAPRRRGRRPKSAMVSAA